MNAQLILAIVLLPLAVMLGIYALATANIFFKFQKEGTASATVRGDSLNDIIASWRGRYINRQGFPGYDASKPAHEVLPCDPDNPPPPYHSAILNLLTLWGIYYVGFFPFVQVHWRKFEWTESKVEDGVNIDWTRKEVTNIIYLQRFTYRFTLRAAEENTNKPVDLHFSLTLECTNPRLALFEIADWMAQLTVDAFDLARAFVGSRSFEEIRSPRGTTITTASAEFSAWMQTLNTSLPTKGVGAPDAYGIRITDADLIDIALTGSNAVELAKATQAKGIATALAEARVETAKGNAEAARIEGKGQADAIKVVYDEIDRHPASGVAIRQAEAMERAAQKGATVIFGSGNATPLINIPTNQGQTSQGPQTPPSPAPSNPPIPPT